MPTSERDVLELMNRAAMNPPQMHLSTPEVLASARARRRSRRVSASSMALAAVVLAAVAWVGFGPGIDDVLGDVQPAEKIEWDDTVDFEAPLPSDDSSWQGFVGASLSREVGSPDFVVDFADGEGAEQLESVEGDLPAGVNLFTNNGASLLVSQDSYDASPFLDLNRSAGTDQVTQVEVSDSGVDVHVWIIDGEVSASSVRDIYWLLPEQVVTSRDAAVLNEVIEVGGEEIPIMIVESTGRWAERSWEGMRMISSAQIDGNDLYARSRGNAVFAVLPDDARGPAFRVIGSAFDSENRMIEADREVEATVRFAGDYQLLWAEVDQSDFVSDGFAYVETEGMSSDPYVGLSLEVEDRPGGVLAVRLTGAQGTVQVDESSASQPTVSAAPDGSALGVGWMSDMPRDEADPAGPGLDLVFDTPTGLIRGQDLGPFGSLPVPVPERSDLLAVAMPPGSLTDTDADVMPTFLFDTPAGPQWVGQQPPKSVEVREKAVAVSIDDSLGVWAAGCGTAPSVVGRIGSTDIDLMECPDTVEIADDPFDTYVVLVLPKDTAEGAEPVTSGLGIDPDFAEVADPVIADLGNGLSLWALPMNIVGEGREGTLNRSIVGVDLNGDGVPD